MMIAIMRPGTRANWCVISNTMSREVRGALMMLPRHAVMPTAAAAMWSEGERSSQNPAMPERKKPLMPPMKRLGEK
ncbi:MAG TPA: hypothetical protein PK380_07355, partial [Deltaproteobacteria bacterium]|nr:hypothetical protein [Deltaproteobacteria bacterium]